MKSMLEIQIVIVTLTEFLHVLEHSNKNNTNGFEWYVLLVSLCSRYIKTSQFLEVNYSNDRALLRIIL